ncbi:cucumisin [Quercus suber]|uniref:Cucumisin n=1 Tax=Quercus suber TaxID=58331 RepID=A0AAW0LDE1_QUESU
MYPIIYSGDAPNTTSEFNSRYCHEYSLDQNLVKGKIVLCDALTDGSGPFLAGAVGAVMQGRNPNSQTMAFPLPASYLSFENGGKIRTYLNSTRSPTATILRSNESKDTLAPYIAPFSSRGPNPATHNILKPDLAAPGVNILAAWSPISPISGVEFDKRSNSYNIISGTSMACPHATAVATYIKSFHPTWSPASIRSALMTTADPMSAEKNPDAEFAYGAGNINPLKAPNPGLIYDIDALDYIKFLCAQGYNTKLLQYVTGDKSRCSKETDEKSLDLNYPSFALSIPLSNSISHVFNRTVTNVGSSTSTYKAIVTSPHGLSIKVNPSVLSFTSLKQKLSFALTIEGTIEKQIVSASLIWDDGTFQVRSPIVVYTKSFNGFVAKLTKEEAQKLAGMEGIVSVFPNEKNYSTQPGHGTSWTSPRLSKEQFLKASKIIGARYYHSGRKLGASEFASPRDSEGHGSHIASIAAGNVVSGASLLGLGTGTARGGVRSARISVYKICWSDGCFVVDILAAFDDAINDGVDIISLSIGGFSPLDYFKDSIAIGAFHAMRNGILTSSFAGNSGPSPATIMNFSPWSLSVAASTIDRKFVAKVKLGDGELYEGLSINTSELQNKKFPIVYGGDVPNTKEAYPMSVDTNIDVEFAYRAGHINPMRAINPGLVYDAEEVDCVNFLCGQGYSSKSLRLVTGNNFSYSEATKMDRNTISGSFIWYDGVHQVRSPVIAYVSF